MKITELWPVPHGDEGTIRNYCNYLEPHELGTLKFLVKYGFDIDVLKPSSAPGSNNPDIFARGVIWEIKAPMTYNRNKLENQVRKASRQSDRMIFDLRYAQKDVDKIENEIVRLFKAMPRAREMLVITHKKVVDFRKD